jgi:hypothetical protein
MLREMSDQQMSSAAGQSRPADVVGGELVRKSAVEPP